MKKKLIFLVTIMRKAYALIISISFNGSKYHTINAYEV